MPPTAVTTRILLPTFILLVGILIGASPGPDAQDVMDVRLIRVVDEAGRPRLLVGAPLPDPQVQGQVYERARPVPGIMFLDTLGNETGGIGLFDDIDGGGVCFDYRTAEAVCLTKAARFDYVGLTFLAPPRPGARVGEPGPERLGLALAKGTAQFTLSDPAGNPRIRLRADSGARAAIEILDDSGRVVYAVPEGR